MCGSFLARLSLYIRKNHLFIVMKLFAHSPNDVTDKAQATTHAATWFTAFPIKLPFPPVAAGKLNQVNQLFIYYASNGCFCSTVLRILTEALSPTSWCVLFIPVCKKNYRTEQWTFVTFQNIDISHDSHEFTSTYSAFQTTCINK